MTEPTAWDAYFWPGTQTFVNKLGIQDPAKLHQVEYIVAAGRQAEITRGDVEIPRTFDAEHVSAVHRHLFGDLYEWAGELRTVDMFKGGSGFALTPHEIGAQLTDAAAVARSTDWAGSTREQFVEGISAFYAHFNHAHPFREGNGRVGKLLVTQLAEQSPYVVDFDRASTAWWNHASAATHPQPGQGLAPDPAPLRAVFDQLAVDRPPTPREPSVGQGQGEVITAATRAAAAPRRAADPAAVGERLLTPQESSALRTFLDEPTAHPVLDRLRNRRERGAQREAPQESDSRRVRDERRDDLTRGPERGRGPYQ